jgi:Fe-Mn family superoxide dismutase
MKHEMPQLKYAKNALEPKMSQETLEYHYGKHLQAYVDNLNRLTEHTEFETMPLEDIIRKAEGPVFNNAAQTWNHTFFFNQLTPEHSEMPESFKDALCRDFGSVETFKEKFTKAAAALFGSGWVWLVKDKDNKLDIISEPNAGNPLRKGLTPVMTIDVWEHAYYIDYRNKRADFINAVWELTDWDRVGELYATR